MTHEINVEMGRILDSLAQAEQTSAPVRGDWNGLRKQVGALIATMSASRSSSQQVLHHDYSIELSDGHQLSMRWYYNPEATTESAIAYAHGGGRILGSVALYDQIVTDYVAATSIPFLSIEYRLAPEVQGDTSTRDVFAGLKWLIDHAANLQVDPQRIGLMGDSAGGGLAAGAAILARDEGIRVARQILIYPMLDDRTLHADASTSPYLTWTHDNNFTGWSAVLGDQVGSENVSPVIAPARLTEAEGLADAYIEVGDLDIFRDEDVAYALTLSKAGVPVELHVHPGMPHAYDIIAPQAEVVSRIMQDRLRAITSF